MKNRQLIPFIIALVAALFMVVSIFLPYSSATETHAETIKENPDVIVYKDPDITSGELLDISMFEYARIYALLSEDLYGNAAVGFFYVAMVGLIGGFALLNLLFVSLKKPIPGIVFSVLAFAVFLLQNWDYTDRGVVPSRSYEWGIGYYVFFAVAVIALAGNIWMLVEKILLKKQAKLQVIQ